MALTSIQTPLLDAIASATVHSTSYIQGEAAEITEYLTQKIATLQAEQKTKATVLDFVNDGEALSIAIAGIIGNPLATNLVDALVKTAQDGETGNFFALVGDALVIYKDIKAFKK